MRRGCRAGSSPLVGEDVNFSILASVLESAGEGVVIDLGALPSPQGRQDQRQDDHSQYREVASAVRYRGLVKLPRDAFNRSFD